MQNVVFIIAEQVEFDASVTGRIEIASLRKIDCYLNEASMIGGACLAKHALTCVSILLRAQCLSLRDVSHYLNCQ
jgi:hypothetical protein